MSPHYKVAIIGTGAGGLGAVKNCLDAGLECAAFEKRGKVGGLWNLDEDSPAYWSLTMNTSKVVSQFSDFPFPEGEPFYPERQEVIDYLNAYADNYRLSQREKCSHGMKRRRGWRGTAVPIWFSFFPTWKWWRRF